MILLDVSNKISPTIDMWANSGLAIVIVFTALTLLVCTFNLSGYLSKRATAHRSRKQSGISGKIAVRDASQIPANEIAAIAMALRMYSGDYHDTESNVITIKQLKRSYSPWNSKSIRLLGSIYQK
jgi:uncharacterized membrane protein